MCVHGASGSACGQAGSVATVAGIAAWGVDRVLSDSVACRRKRWRRFSTQVRVSAPRHRSGRACCRRISATHNPEFKRRATRRTS
jgi:hypothetical protein